MLIFNIVDMKGTSRWLRRAIMRLNFSRLLNFGRKPEIPERNILVGYVVYMLLGFGLLMLPCSNLGESYWLDNLFTAASALSTTGLATVDIPSSYTIFGQAVILLLIQLGGIGYMTLSSYIIFRLTHHASGDSSKVVSASMTMPVGMKLSDIVNNVIHFTFLFELLGFVSFFFALKHVGVGLPGWNALFLSISSFCTAGFSPFPDSLCMFSENVAINLTVAVLSYAGALGFIVITDLTYKLKRHDYSITFTSKVILLITGIMAVGGTLILALSPTVAPGEDWAHRIWLALFQTMSAMTTVGFNNIDLSVMRVGPILVFSLIMFIGTSPSGTGGGVKCTSVSAVWGFVMSKLGLRDDVTFLGRKIPSYRIDTALTSIIVYGTVIFMGCVVLSYSEPFKLSQILFEATSAIGTVGLSTGITPGLSTVGKIVIIVLMYIGRVGVITLGSALVIRAEKNRKGPLPESDLAA